MKNPVIFIYLWIMLLGVLSFRVGSYILEGDRNIKTVYDTAGSINTSKSNDIANISKGYRIEGIMLSYPKESNYFSVVELEGYKYTVPKDASPELGDHITFTTEGLPERENVNFDSAYMKDPKKSIRLFNIVSEARKKIVDTVYLNLKEPLSSLVLGVTIGYDPNFPGKYKDIFRDAGIMHILVVSGYNVNLIINAAGMLVSKLGKLSYIILMPLIIAVYLIFVGFQAPVVRACFSGILLVLASYSGRPSNPFYTSLLVLMLMLIWRPYYLSSLSFLLTFLAAFGVSLGGSIISSSAQQSLKAFFINEVVSIACVTVFVSPVLLYEVNAYSFSGIISNVLILWVIPYFTILSFFYILLAVLNAPFLLLFPFEFILRVIQDYILFVSKLFLDKGVVGLELSRTGLFVIYFVIFVFFFGILKKNQIKEGS